MQTGNIIDGLILTLRRRYRLILGIVGIGFVIALISAVIQPATYEASVLVLISRPGVQPQFDDKLPSVQTSSAVSAAKAYLNLIKSHDVLVDARQRLEPDLPEADRAIAALDQATNVRSIDDPNLIKIAVTHANPEVARKIANAVAQATVVRINTLLQPYGSGNNSLDNAAQDAEKSLREANTALANFYGQSPLAALQRQVDITGNNVARLTAIVNDIDVALVNAQGIRQQLVNNGNNPAPPSLALAQLQLQTTALSEQSTEMAGAGQQTPASQSKGQQFVIMVDLARPGISAEQQLRELDNLVAALQAQRQQLSGVQQQQITLLITQRQQLQVQQAEESRLQLAHKTAETAVTSVRNKAAEERVAGALRTGEAQVASSAGDATPRNGLTSRALNVGLTTLMALVLSVVLALVVEGVARIRQRPVGALDGRTAEAAQGAEPAIKGGKRA